MNNKANVEASVGLRLAATLLLAFVSAACLAALGFTIYVTIRAGQGSNGIAIVVLIVAALVGCVIANAVWARLAWNCRSRGPQNGAKLMFVPLIIVVVAAIRGVAVATRRGNTGIPWIAIAELVLSVLVPAAVGVVLSVLGNRLEKYDPEVFDYAVESVLYTSARRAEEAEHGGIRTVLIDRIRMNAYGLDHVLAEAVRRIEQNQQIQTPSSEGSSPGNRANRDIHTDPNRRRLQLELLAAARNAAHRSG